MTDHLKIGDPWPFKSARGLTGRPLKSPVWFALVVGPQKEKRTANQLKNAGVNVEYPVDDRVRHHNGKKYEYQVPMISRIVYAQFEYAPHWDVMKDRKIITGVFCNGVHPVQLDDAVVRAMCNLPEVEDELEKARIAAKTPDIGEQVELRGGLFNGFRVDVVRTEYGRVWYKSVTAVGTMQGDADVDDVQRLANGE